LPSLFVMELLAERLCDARTTLEVLCTDGYGTVINSKAADLLGTVLGQPLLESVARSAGTQAQRTRMVGQTSAAVQTAVLDALATRAALLTVSSGQTWRAST
jgi:hypothetical protein